jgi:hypothetical protein
MAAVPELIQGVAGRSYTRKDTGAQVPDLAAVLQDREYYNLAAWGAENIKNSAQVRDCICQSLKPNHALPARLARTYLRSFNYFCKCTKFVVERTDLVLYNDLLGYAARIDLVGRFDYKGILHAEFPAVVQVVVDDEPHFAGLALAGQKLAAMRNRLVRSTALCGLVRLTASEYEYTDMTDAGFLEVIRVIFNGAKTA